MTIDEQIVFCEEKSKNIKLKAKPQTFVDIAESLKRLKEYERSNGVVVKLKLSVTIQS